MADDLLATLDGAKVSRFHLRAALVSGMGFFTDAYDLFVIGIASSLIQHQWGLSSGKLSLLNATMLAAACLGALMFGRIADLVGRKRVYWLVAAIMIVAAIGSALSPSFWVLIAFRFLLGLGVGGDYPVSAVLMTEYANQKDRGRLVSLVFSTQALGLIVGPAVALALLGAGASDNLAWRLLLGLGALPAAAVVYLRRRMPESPRYTAQVQGQDAQAAQDLVGFIGPATPVTLNGQVAAATSNGQALPATSNGPVIPATPDGQVAAANGAAGTSPAPRQPARRRARLVDFLSDRRLLLILAGTAGSWFLLDYAYYGNTISTPQILSLVSPNASTIDKVAIQLAIFVVAAVPGYFLAMVRMDRIGHRLLQLIGFIMMAVCFAVLGLAPGMTTTVAPFLLVYGVSYFFTEFGPNVTTFVLPGELFPVSFRATGHGISAGVGKFGAFIGVFLFPLLQSSMHLRGTLLLTAGLAVVGALLTLVLPEPAGRSLEEISGTFELMTAKPVLTEAPAR